MIINRNSGNTQFVRTNPTGQVKSGSFGEALNQASAAKDTFSSSSVSGTVFSQSSVSTVPGTQAKLDKISAVIKDTDYSEMTKAEIYADIEKKYEDAFDDFHMTMAVWSSEDHRIIHTQFLEDVNNNIGSMRIPRELIQEARGYSDMTYDEIEVSIKKKYVGKTGFVDQLNLFGELYSAGVLSNKFGRDEAIEMSVHLTTSLECGGDRQIPKNEWLSRIEQTGASSPFSLLINNPYFANMKDFYQEIVDDILFGVVGVIK